MPHVVDGRRAYQMFCETCYLKKAAYRRCGSKRSWTVLKEKWDEQEGRCSYTGEKLIMGQNASVDHILPVSRFPEKKADKSNIEWISMEINTLKGTRTKDEFTTLVKAIARHLFAEK